MNKSESIKNLALALLKAQATVGVIPMNATNPFYKSEYADLGSHINKIQPALWEYNLVVTQFVSSDNGQVGITNLLMHTTSGEWLEQSAYMEVPKTQNPAQEAGKIISYLRRYSLAALMNVYSGDDTDAEVAPIKPAPAKTERPYLPEHLKDKIATLAKDAKECTPGERGLVVGVLNTTFNGKEKERHAVCKYLTGHESSKGIPANYITAMITWLGLTKNEDGKWENIPSDNAIKEAKAVLHEVEISDLP